MRLQEEVRKNIVPVVPVSIASGSKRKHPAGFRHEGVVVLAVVVLPAAARVHILFPGAAVAHADSLEARGQPEPK
jgi:hypothetical protein